MENYNQEKYIKEIEEEFKITFDTSYDLLFSEFHGDAYDGDCWVIFYDYNTHKMYEVLTSHDSTDGFAGNWRPEEVTKEEILYRINNKGHNKFNTEIVISCLNSINDNLEFDFDNIPTPKELAEITNLKKLDTDDNIIQNKEHFISYLKKEIVSAIKKSVFNTKEECEIILPVPLSIIAGAIAQHNPSSLIPYIEKNIQPVIDKLKKQDWDAKMNVEFKNGIFNSNVNIKTPCHILKEESATKSKKVKPH